jgi:hypothetical protein
MDATPIKDKMRQITAGLILQKMQIYGIKNETELAELTGINYTSLTAATTGARPFSGEIIKVLYFYFELKAAEKIINELTKIDE